MTLSYCGYLKAGGSADMFILYQRTHELELC